MEHYACVFHLPITEFDNLEKILLEYDVGEYLIGHEVSPFSHFHLVVQLPCKKQWNAFQKRVIERYDLRGKATKGKARQYGALKQIHDIEKLKAYTVKQKNVKTNMKAEDFKKYIEASYTSANNRGFYEKVLEHLESKEKLLVLETKIISHGNQTTFECETEYFPKIYKEILRFCIENSYKITPAQVKSWAYSYVQQSERISTDKKIEILMTKLKY